MLSITMLSSIAIYAASITGSAIMGVVVANKLADADENKKVNKEED